MITLHIYIYPIETGGESSISSGSLARDLNRAKPDVELEPKMYATTPSILLLATPTISEDQSSSFELQAEQDRSTRDYSFEKKLATRENLRLVTQLLHSRKFSMD